MPAFGATLWAQKIRALVVYIREESARFKRGQTRFARPAGTLSVSSELHAFRLETVTESVKAPWALAFMPDGASS